VGDGFGKVGLSVDAGGDDRELVAVDPAGVSLERSIDCARRAT
jgi:hypothetical protein